MSALPSVSSLPASAARFYVTGGSLPDGAPSYLTRRADHELLDALRRGEFCYVLDTRQVGKSSLIVRTAAALRQEKTRVAILDLSAAGQNIAVEQWYYGLLYSVAAQLGLEEEIERFWAARLNLGPAQRWMAALCEVALPRADTPLVVFVDEIDAVRSLPFSADEFFIVLRECYNRRAQEPLLRHLTFCLVGVATPAQLIRDARSTPFNIGQRIELTDFTEAEAQPLAQWLGPVGDGRRALLQQVLFWTGGHPYLTQRLCRALAEEGQARSPADVDRLCANTFLTRQGRETDPNLAFARDRMLSGDGADPASVLLLYGRIRSRGAAPHDPTDPRADILRLAGVVRVADGALRVRNRLYSRAFDTRWVAANLPGQELRRQKRALWRGILRASGVWLVILAALLAAFAESRQVQTLSGFAREKQQESRLWAARASAFKEKASEEQRSALQIGRRLTGFRNSVQTTRASLRVERRKLGRTNQMLDQKTQALASAKRKINAAEQTRQRIEQQMQAAQAQILQTQAEIARRNGPSASALAALPGNEFAALTFGLRAVRPALQTGREPDSENLQGLADAVNAGIVRRLHITHTTPLFDACWSPDARKIAIGGGNSRVYIHDNRTGKLLQTLALPSAKDGHGFATQSVAFSPDGKQLLTATTDGKARLWDVSGRQAVLHSPLRVLPMGGQYGFAAAFFPDGKRVITTAGNDACIWNLTDGSRRVLKGHDSHLWSVAVSRDGTRVATAGEDGMVKVWDPDTGALIAETDQFLQGATQMHVISDNWRGATGVRFAWDTLLCVGKGTTAFTYVWSQNVIHRIYPHPQGMLWAGDVSNDESLVATVGHFRTLTVWNKGRSEVPLLTLRTHRDDIYGVRFAPNSREIVTASKDRSADVWTLTQPLFFNTGDAMSHAEFSRQGTQFLCAGADGSVHLYRQTADGRKMQTIFNGGLHGGLFGVVSAAYSPDGGHVATADNRGLVRLWETHGPDGVIENSIRAYSGHQGAVNAVAFSPDGRRLATGGDDGTLRLWNVASGGEAVPLFSAPGVKFRSVRFSRDGRYLAASASDGAVYVRDAETLRPVGPSGGVLLTSGRRRMANAESAPNDAAFSPDGRFLAASDRNGSVYLWQTQTWKLAAVLPETSGEAFSVDFSPNGTRLVSAYADGACRLWRLPDALSAARKGKTVTPYLVLRGHADTVLSARFSPDGEQIITASKDGTGRLFPATAHAYVKKAREMLALKPR